MLTVALLLSCVSFAAAMRCTLVSVSGVNFGGYDVFSTAPTESVGFVAYRCTAVAAADTLAIELSRGRSHTYLPRAMKYRNQQLEYNLYTDAARTVVWGDGTRGTTRYLVRPAEGATVSVPIYARIPARQNVRAGAYDDTILLTVQY